MQTDISSFYFMLDGIIWNRGMGIIKELSLIKQTHFFNANEPLVSQQRIGSLKRRQSPKMAIWITWKTQFKNWCNLFL